MLNIEMLPPLFSFILVWFCIYSILKNLLLYQILLYVYFFYHGTLVFTIMLSPDLTADFHELFRAGFFKDVFPMCVQRMNADIQ